MAIEAVFMSSYIDERYQLGIAFVCTDADDLTVMFD